MHLTFSRSRLFSADCMLNLCSISLSIRLSCTHANELPPVKKGKESDRGTMKSKTGHSARTSSLTRSPRSFTMFAADFSVSIFACVNSSERVDRRLLSLASRDTSASNSVAGKSGDGRMVTTCRRRTTGNRNECTHDSVLH